MKMTMGKWLEILVVTSLILVAGRPAQAQPIRAPENLLEIEHLVRVRDLDPTILEDIRYATENNFTHKKIYSLPIAILRKETALKLVAANAEFKKQGQCIKIWDGYRPPSVQKIFWDMVPDERYVANPNKGGSKHNRGGAVDITLVDASGKEVEMPSDFDDFSDKALPKSPFGTAEARLNAEHLELVMARNGFTQDEHEWWHFNDASADQFPLVDVAFERFVDQGDQTSVVLKGLDHSIQEAILVTPIASQKSQATVSAWERRDDQWHAVYSDWAAAVGRNGIAPAGEKKEGDGRTPSGIFKIGPAFGYAKGMQTHLTYRQATENDFWVDDPQSPQYNQWVSGKPDAKSFESMKRPDSLYKYGAVIEYNTNPVVAGKGSAIFLHVWRGPESSTAGCVAMPEEKITRLLRWLDAAKNPVVIIQP